MMKPGKLLAIAAAILFLIGLAGCDGTEIARVPIQSVGDFSDEFQHNGKSITLWTDLDVEYTGETQIWYEIDFLQNGDRVSNVVCDPHDVEFRLMSRRTQVRGVSKLSYLAPMKCEVTLPGGEITINVRLNAIGGQIKIFRADLIVNEKE